MWNCSAVMVWDLWYPDQSIHLLHLDPKIVPMHAGKLDSELNSSENWLEKDPIVLEQSMAEPELNAENLDHEHDPYGLKSQVQ